MSNNEYVKRENGYHVLQICNAFNDVSGAGSHQTILQTNIDIDKIRFYGRDSSLFHKQASFSDFLEAQKDYKDYIVNSFVTVKGGGSIKVRELGFTEIRPVFTTEFKINDACVSAIEDNQEEIISGNLKGRELIDFLESFKAVRHNLRYASSVPADTQIYRHDGKLLKRHTRFEDGLRGDMIINGKRCCPAVQVIDTEQGDNGLVIAAQYFNKGIAGEVLSHRELIELNNFSKLVNGKVPTTTTSYSVPIFNPDELDYEP